MVECSGKGLYFSVTDHESMDVDNHWVPHRHRCQNRGADDMEITGMT